LNEEQQASLTGVVSTGTNTLNPKIVGKSASVIAGMAGISLPEGTRAMICPINGVGRDYPLSIEKLSPILAYYVVDGLSEGAERCAQILRYGGMGHTASIHTRSREAAKEFGALMPASRVIVNSPSTLGAIGFTTELEPSMTLGCGSWGGNVTSDNISPRHLVDVKRIAFETRPVNREADAEITRAAFERTQAAGSGARVNRAAITALVDRFLAERQSHEHQPSTPAPSPASSPSAALPSTSFPEGSSRPSPSTSIPTSGSSSPSSTESGEAPVRGQAGISQSKPAAASNGASTGRVYDFVCEEDVRTAIASKQKILINAKTIITPSARELGEEREVFSRS